MTTDDQRADERYLREHGATPQQINAWRTRHPWGRSASTDMDDYLKEKS